MKKINQVKLTKNQTRTLLQIITYDLKLILILPFSLVNAKSHFVITPKTGQIL